MSEANSLGRAYGQIADATTKHFVFLIDTSGSMRKGGVATHFARLHAELLDELAVEHPGAVVSCLTFTEKPDILYVAQPVADALSLDMDAKFGTDLPVAICSGLAEVLNDRLDSEKITVIIVTDGDTESHTGHETRCDAKRAISRLRCYGVQFLLLVALDGKKNTAKYKDNPLDYVQKDVAFLGIKPEEVLLWEHTADALSAAFGKVGETLALGAANSGQFREATPCHHDDSNGDGTLPSDQFYTWPPKL